ncbi:MAG: hypothetical protein IKR57_00880 [Bacilli bacterium]|nr:hypothetical protein [Bacilli bacterium]
MKNLISSLYYKRYILYIIIGLVIAFIIAQKLINVNPRVDKNSEHYINSIYMSDGRIYESYLDENSQKLYIYLMENIKKRKKVIYIKPIDFGYNDYKEVYNVLSTVTHAIMIDHPELLSFGGWMAQYKAQKGEITFWIKNSFKLPFMDKIGEVLINKKIHDIQKETKNMTDKEKIKYVYNWIGKNTKYDKIFMYDSKNQTIYNVFVNHNAVCAGFAKASQVIFQALGIKSYIVLGNTTGAHMWNIVEVDGKNYYYDSTVAACITEGHSAYYDGLKQSEFNNYKESYDWFPKVETTNLYEDYELED